MLVRCALMPRPGKTIHPCSLFRVPETIFPLFAVWKFFPVAIKDTAITVRHNWNPYALCVEDPFQA